MAHSPPPPPNRRRMAVSALGLLLGAPALALALLLAFGALVVFNGCMRSPGPAGELLSMAWLFCLWPLAALGAALVPALQIRRGRSPLRALAVFGVGAVLAAGVFGLGLLLMNGMYC